MAWGIVGAVEGEVLPIIDIMSQTSESRWSEQAIFQGQVLNRDVVVMTTGVGKGLYSSMNSRARLLSGAL